MNNAPQASRLIPDQTLSIDAETRAELLERASAPRIVDYLDDGVYGILVVRHAEHVDTITHQWTEARAERRSLAVRGTVTAGGCAAELNVLTFSHGPDGDR